MSLTYVVKSKAGGTPFQLNFHVFLRVYHTTTASHHKCDVCTAVSTKGQQNLQHLHSPTAWVSCHARKVTTKHCMIVFKIKKRVAWDFPSHYSCYYKTI